MFSTLVLLATAAWHSLAAYHFLFFPARTLARTTQERPVNRISVELFRFLGGINFSLVVLGVAACFVNKDSRWLAFLTLMISNLSQALIDLWVKRIGLVSGAFFQQILVGDFLFTGLTGLCLLIG